MTIIHVDERHISAAAHRLCFRARCCAGTSLDSKDSTAAASQASRCNSRIQSVKDAVADLRASVKGAIAYREKCSLTLSAAMGATLALEQVGLAPIIWHQSSGTKHLVPI